MPTRWLDDFFTRQKRKAVLAAEGQTWIHSQRHILGLRPEEDFRTKTCRSFGRATL